MESQKIAVAKFEAEAIRRSDHSNMVLLIVLYMLQGVPMGLVMGSIPFLLQSKLTYTELGIFSIAGYPYALKLFWSPVVDACYSKHILSSSLRKRKSWIIPIQLVAGLMMYIIGLHVEEVFARPEIPVYFVTFCFLCLTILVATQDIAVDGWALTLLSKPMRGWASTCQTIGLNSGFFMSFTIFLALNSAEFCNKYLRAEPSPEGLLPLSTYIQVWAFLFLVVTFYLAFAKNEKPDFRTHGAMMTSSSSSSSASSLSSSTAAAAASRDDFFSAGSRGKSSELMIDHGEKDKQTRERERVRQVQKESRRMMGSTIVVNEGDDSDFEDHSHQRHNNNNNHNHNHNHVSEADYDEFDSNDDDDDEEEVTVRAVFWKIWKLVNLPNMRTLLLLMLVYKLGFMAADTVSALKLIEKGFKREDLALFVLIEFPFQIFFAVLAGKWASGRAPLTSFMVGFKLRLVISALGGLVIYFFPSEGISTPYYFVVLALTLATSFSGTIQFVSQGAFFTRISDLSIGGTYLTLLNTFANLGGTWPKFFVLYFVDLLTVKQCVGEGEELAQVGSCVAKEKADECAALGGTCEMEVDGYYPVVAGCFVIGLGLVVLLQRRLVPLERMKASDWKFKQ